MHSMGYLAVASFAAMLLAPYGAAQTSKQGSPGFELNIRSFGAVCDGSDDGPAVQAALEALPDNATLLVPCKAAIGPSELLLRDRRGVTVMGTQGGGFQALAPNHNRILLRLNSCHGCTVADLAIDGGNVGVAAIALERCVETVVRNNTITDIGYPAHAAILGWGNRDNLYTGNLIANTGILYNAEGEIVNATRGIWLGNEKREFYEWRPRVLDNRLHHIGGTAIVVHAYSAVVERNVGENLLWSGIKVVAPADARGTTRLADNRFQGTGGSRYSGGGIQLGSELGNAETIVVENNILDGDIESGIYAARGPVTGRFVNNTIRNTLQAGISLLCETRDLLVQGNRIERGDAGKQGIRLIADRGVEIRGVEITGNQIRGRVENGILILTNGGSVDGVSIHSNTLADNAWYGVFMEEKAGANAIRNIELGPNCYQRNGRGALGDGRPHKAEQPPSVCPAPAVP